MSVTLEAPVAASESLLPEPPTRNTFWPPPALRESLLPEPPNSVTFVSPVADSELLPAPPFYPAEAYHQDYFARNARQPYCQVVIAPKVAKVRQKYLQRLKRA